MGLEQDVAAYYTRGMLQEKILNALKGTGKNPDQLQSADFAALDNFHLGGREATENLASFMGLRPGMHLLDVGCGIGGPARYFAEQGCRVTGIDLTEEFVHVAESLTQMLKLHDRIQFRQASALELPFHSGTFDGAYMIHVGMNIEDKRGVYRELARVLKKDGIFAIFDIMRMENGKFEFPMPWAVTPTTSFVSTVHEYRDALESTGFRIIHQRERRQFAIEFRKRVMAQPAPPVLGVHLLMGEQAPTMLKNVGEAIEAGSMEPIELVAIRS